MKRIIAAFALAFTPLAVAQVCDVTYSLEVETAAGNDVGTSVNVVRALPLADVLDNAAKFNRVIDAASKAQDQGGPYTIIMDETRVCDGGAPVKAQGIEVRGVTLRGSVKIADVALRQGDAINDRYRARAAKGDKEGWNHGHAKKVHRDDVGKRKP